MKKSIITLLIVIALVLVYKIFTYNKIEIIDDFDYLQKEIEQVNLIENEKPYNIIKSTWPQADILGNVLSINENTVIFEEIVSLECFYVFDLIDEFDGDANPSKQEIDSKYNIDHLPWCTDPSGGSYYENTGKIITLNFSPDATFSIFLNDVDKDVFMKKVSDGYCCGHKVMIGVKLHEGNIISIDEVYND